MTSVTDLKGKERELERVRLASQMTPLNIGLDKSHMAFPIELVGTPQQAEGLIDLIWANAHVGNIAIIIQNVPKTGFRVDAELATILKVKKGFLEAPTLGETYVILLSHNDETGMTSCHFGYSPRGVAVVRGPDGIIVNFENQSTHEHIVEMSLFKLYRLTGNVKFADSIGHSKMLVATKQQHVVVAAVDPLGFFTVLGLNPFLPRFMSEEMIDSMIGSIKRGLAAQLHPDAANSTPTDLAYLKKANEAAQYLSDATRRKEYMAWL